MVIQACLVADTIKNTGKECDVSMGPTAMLLAVPRNFKFTLASIQANPVAWANTAIHAAQAVRIFPLFGYNAPIRTITNDKENDVLITLDDGSKVLLRYGFFNRTYETTSGGICYAESLQSLNKSGYSIIEIDASGQMLVRQNSDGTYGGLITDFMYSPSPILADLKSTPYKNIFNISYSPVEYVQNGVILAGTGAIISLMGLIDSNIAANGAQTVQGATAPTLGNVTITAVGSTNDTIDVSLLGVELTSAPVIQTSSETTATLMAAKVAANITANAANNGGITAINGGGIITFTIPTSFGTSLNGISPVATVVGTITKTTGSFSGGAYGTVSLPISVKTHCAQTDLIAMFGNTLAVLSNFVITKVSDGSVVTPTGISIVNGAIVFTGLPVSTALLISGALPSVWLAANIDGYDATVYPLTVTTVA